MAASLLEPLLTSKAVAELLAVALPTVYAWQREGVLPGVRLGRGGRTIRYRRADVERFLRTRRQLQDGGRAA